MNHPQSPNPEKKIYVIRDKLHPESANDNPLPWRKKWRAIGAGILILLTLLWAFLET
jgi:hypothetical protein